jgi:hypothetical protein
MQPGMQLNTTLNTKATLIDLTNVYYDTVAVKYTVVTYKGVNPSGWVNNLNRSYIAPQMNNFDTVQAYMYYTNVPNSNNFFFSQNYINVQGYGYAGFLGLTCDTVLLGTTRVISAISYAKSF